LLSLEHPDGAREQYAAVLHLDPAAADVYDRLGVALTVLRRFDEAIRAFVIAARLKPDLADAYNHWGVALSMQGWRDEAIDRYREALRYDPSNEDAHYNLRLAEEGRAAATVAEP
jgi:protein O-GlcNAc transferase